VHHRDGGKCCVPSCRSARFNEVHHIVGRAEGGSHDAGNLTLMCDGHHRALHAGTLVITGIAPNLTVRFPHVETSSFALAAMTAQAKQALRTMGFHPSTVQNALDSALASDPRPTTLEELIVAALKKSRPPVKVYEPENI
jgi:hypothetical protein